MSYLLHIDTAVTTASVCISDNEIPLAVKKNPETKDSASWLQPAIRELLQEQEIALKKIQAISISAGPGSYTGLRVGMATAKGLCYALQIPLITISTLRMMAYAAKDQDADLLCPMIDARRMEVFAAVFDKHLNEVVAPANFVLDENSFSDLLIHHRVCFFGNGSNKLAQMIGHRNVIMPQIEASASYLCYLAFDAFKRKSFADLAYAEPIYLKEFYSTAPLKK